MKKKTKSRLLDVFIVALCISVCVSCLFLFWKDINRSTERRDKDSIATIAYKYKIAQRKFDDRVVWERLQQNAPLYNADMIRTAEQSLATITFNDGTVIDINASSMLQIFYDENGYSVSIGDGDIDIDTTSSSELKKSVAVKMNDGSLLKLDNGSKVSASSNVQSGIKNVSLQAGNVSIETVSGEKEKLTAGESIRIESRESPVAQENPKFTDKVRNAISNNDKSEKKENLVSVIKKEPVTVVSIPKDMKLLSFEEKKQPVEIVWKKASVNSEVPVKLEVSYDKEFKKIEKEVTSAELSSATIESEPGKTVYWRVYAEGAEESASTGKISSEVVPAVRIQTPVSRSVFKYLDETPSISFEWTGNEFASRYKLEVSDNLNFSNLVYSCETTDTKTMISSLKDGKYYCRIVPYYIESKIGYSHPSEATSFAVSKIEKILPPSLIIPSDNSTVTSSSSGSEMTFAWKSDSLKSEYEILISKKADFSDLIYKNKTDKKRIACNFKENEMSQGKYYWKIETQNEKGETVSSETRSFNLKKYVPGINRLIYPPEHFSVEKEKLASVNFMWKLSEEYKADETKSVLIVSKSSDFSSDVTEINCEELSVSGLKLKDGKYFWRVALLNEKVSDKPAYTETRSFTVLNELLAPKLISPASGQTITVYGENNIKFKWNKVAGADYYNLKVYEIGTDKIINQINVRETDVELSLPVLKNAENRIRYGYSVQALSEETAYSGLRQSKISENSFNLRLRQPVQLLYPANNTVVDGLKALRQPVVFNWKPVDKVQYSKFELRKLQMNGTYKTIKAIENPDQTVKMNRLESGKYEWTISASGVNGIPLDAEKSLRFEIKEIPLLEKPMLALPSEKTVFSADYFRKNRHIDFSWKPVDGASDYEFTLYQKKKDGSLHRIVSQKNIRKNEFRYKNLKALDIGKFEWQVKAFSHASDGFEEQKSSVSSGNFVIDFGLPEKVKTIETGKMYGD